MNPKVSVIITFYNKLEFLKLVLAGFERQSFKNFEIIIADDGSRDEIVEQLKKYIEKSNLKITHVWHEDKGWQKNIILNKAVIKSNSDYIIINDGDCIPHKHFVKEHFQNKEINTVLAGRRVMLSKYLSEKLNESNVRHGILEFRYALFGIVSQVFFGGLHLENAIYFRNKWIRKFINKKPRGILGCNFSLHKKDLLAINGFDERYKNPGIGEDTDLEHRLRNNGVKIKTVKHIAIQYHLYHKLLKRSNDELIILNKVKEEKTTYTPFGIIKDAK